MNIIFDFFGVICSEVSPIWLKRYFSVDEAVLIKNSLVSSADIGEITSDELFIELSKKTNISPEQIYNDWMKLAKIDNNLVDYIIKLKQSKHLKMSLLSNAPSKFLRNILDNHSLEGLFDVIIISSEVKVSKPSRNIFLMLLNELNIEPQDAIFIDDNMNNIDTAKSLDMKTIHFVNTQELITELSLYIE